MEVVERERDEGVDGGLAMDEHVERVVGACIEAPTTDAERVRARGKPSLDLGAARFPHLRARARDQGGEELTKWRS